MSHSKNEKSIAMKKILLFLVILLANNTVIAQESTSNIIQGAPNVFLDCQWYCDFDAFRNNIKYINFVRDRQSADIQVLVSRQSVGTGGSNFTLYYTGLGIYKNTNDTISVITKSDDTEKEENDLLMKAFKKGLISYLIISPLKDKISYSVNIKADKTDKNTFDPWNSWVFSVRSSAYINAVSDYNNISLWGSLSASKITKEKKIKFRFGANYRESNYNTRDSLNIIVETFSSFRKSKSFSASYIHSITDHLSAGIFYSIFDNLYSNYKLSTGSKIGIEYNLYKYEESDRRQFIVQYQIGGKYNDYVEETIYDKEKEFLFEQNISIGLYQKQNWGNLYVGIDYSNYLHDFKKRRLSFDLDIDWNIVKGLTIGFGGNYSIIGDQLNLSKSDIDITDILLRDRLLATNYSLFSRFNIKYTFGSKYNNIVNSRFDSSGGNYYYF